MSFTLDLIPLAVTDMRNINLCKLMTGHISYYCDCLPATLRLFWESYDGCAITVTKMAIIHFFILLFNSRAWATVHLSTGCLFPRCCHPLERAAVNCVISSGPSVPCMRRAETWWGGSVNTALQGAHMSTFWNISLTLRLSKKAGSDSQHSTHNGSGPVASLSNAIRAGKPNSGMKRLGAF